MRIHFVISKEEFPLYKELIEQLKKLGHNVSHGLEIDKNAEAVVGRGGCMPVPSALMEKLTDSVKKAKERLTLREAPTEA